MWIIVVLLSLIFVVFFKVYLFPYKTTEVKYTKMLRITIYNFKIIDFLMVLFYIPESKVTGVPLKVNKYLLKKLTISSSNIYL